MLDLLSKLSGVNSGVGVVTTSGSSSDLFLQLHYCSTFLRNRKRVLIIASHLTESYYRVIFGKLAIRWDPSLISVIELDSIMGDSLRIDEENFVKAFKKKILESQPDVPFSLIIFDDVSVLERMSIRAPTVVCLIYDLYNRVEEDGLLLAPFSVKTKAYQMMKNKADFNVKLTPVGSGFEKDVTGQMAVTVRGSCPLPETHELLYVAGERSMKCFYPGGSSILKI